MVWRGREGGMGRHEEENDNHGFITRNSMKEITEIHKGYVYIHTCT